MMKRHCFPAAAILFFLASVSVFAVPAAFPGAEGSGRYATGGRGGTVYEVTNLTNSGPGSIVDAVSAGNRTIVFRVSGTIELGDVLLRPKSNTTIAGQTAPGDGICLKGRIYISGVSNVIIRYLRVRVDEGGANSSGDAIDIASGSNIIIDHVSASYARDEGISCQPDSNYVTVQWCIISESLTYESHSYGSLVRGDYGDEKTYHHNLYAHNHSRNPRPGNYTPSSTDPEGLHFDFRNNVVYNWLKTVPGYSDSDTCRSRYNFIGNVYIPGPESTNNGYGFRELSKVNYGYFADNSYNDVVPADPWSIVLFDGFSSAEIAAYKTRSYRVPMEPVTTTSPAQAKIDVLESVGASFPARDIIDARIVQDVINKTGHSIATTDDQPEGAWPPLYSLPAPADTDHDGMPDAWETANGLSPSNAADRNDYTLHLDYTNLEVYLNSIVQSDLEAPAAPTGLAAAAGEGTVALNWNENAEIDLAGYNVYRSTTSGSGYVKLNGSLLTDSACPDTSVSNGTTYFYVVTAVDTSANESDFSNEVFATPIDLNFYGDTNGDRFIDITDLLGFVDVWLESDCLLSSGWDINGDCWVNYEEFSLMASLWRLDRVAPDPPANGSAVSGEGEVWLDWNDNTEIDLAGYNLYRSTTSGSGYVQVNASLIETSEYIDSSVTNGTAYYYVITAVDAASNESGFSNEVSALPNPPTASITIQENETGFCGVEGIIETEHAGYTGTGYANTDNAVGKGVNYRINVLTGGMHTFIFRYAGTSSRPADLIVNGITEVSGIAFPSTGAWTTWSTTAAVEVILTAGIRDIRLEAAAGDGLANIDSMQVSGINLLPAACP